MPAKLKAAIVLLIAGTSISKLNAQVSLTQIDSLIACKKGVFRIMLTVNQPNDTLMIRDSINLSCSGTNSCPGAELSFFKVDSAAAGLNFIYQNGRWKLVFASAGAYTIKYSVAIDCGMIPSCPDSNNTSIKLFQRFYLNNDTASVNNGLASVSHTIFYPYMIDLTQQQFTGNYLDTVNVYHVYKNSGLVEASMYFRFYPENETTCTADSTLEIKWAVGAAGTPALLTYGNTVIAAWDSVAIPAGLALVIRKRIVLKACPDETNNGCNEINDSLEWRCRIDTLQANHCMRCLGSLKNTYALTRSGNAQISYERIYPITNNADYSCMNDTVQWEFRIRNTGTQHIQEAIIQLFCNASDVPSQLLLIDTSTVTLTVHNGNTAVVDSIDFFTQTLCQSDITHSLRNIQWKLNDFMKGDTLTLRFSTFRCCEENNALYNTAKSYGSWALNAFSNTACGIHVNHGVQFISTNPNWNVTADHFPIVTQLNVPKDSVFGPSTPLMFVDIASPSGTWGPNYQLFGCNTLPCPSLNGLMHITLYCEPGLLPDTPLVHLVSYPNQPFRRLDPVYWYAVSNNTCDTNYTHYYFDLSDTNAVHLINNGRIAFRLRSCCGAYYTSQPVYSVLMDFIFSPSSNCVSMDFTDTTHTMPPVCLSQGCCSLPMASSGNKMGIRCPGCLSPGIELNVYNISRISFGVRDTNNDSRADLQVAAIDSAYLNTYQSVMRTTAANYGDKLLDRLLGHFQDGDDSNNGYTYQQMLADTGILNVLQLERTLVSDNPYQVGLTVDSFRLYIDVPEDTLANINCIDCLPFISDTAYRTTHIIHVTGAALNDYVDYDININRILFTFDATDSSRNIFQNVVYSDNTNPFNGYFPQQRYRLMTVYSVCNWYGPASAVNQSPSEQVREFDIGNNMFLCGRKLLLSELDTTRTQPNDMDTVQALGYTSFNQNFANTFEFRCAGYAGRFYFYADEAQNISSYRSVPGDSCHKFIRLNLFTRTSGSAYPGKYPFEYRQPSFAPIRAAAYIPPGYTAAIAGVVFSNTYLTVNNQQFYTSSQHLPVNITTIGDSVIIHLDSVFMVHPLRCVTDTSQFNNTLYAGDNLIDLTIEIPLLAEDCSPPVTQPAIGDITARFTRHSPLCYNVPPVSCSPAIREPQRPNAVDTLRMPRAELTAQTLTVPAYALSNEVCWNISAYNTNLSQGYFLYLNAPVSPFFTDWMLHFQGDTLTPVNGVFHITNSINQNAVYTMQLCARYDSCALQDSLYVLFGWNCYGFPDSVQAAYNACFNDSILLKWTDETINVVSAEHHPQQVSLCTPFTVAGQLISTDNGSIYPQTVSLSNLSGYTLLSGQLSFSQSAAVITLPPGSAPVWNIAPLIDSIGWFNTALLHQGDSITATFTLQKECDMQLQAGDTLDLPQVAFTYTGYCSDSVYYQLARTVPLQPMAYQAVYTGISNCTNCFSITKLTSTDTIATGDTMSFYIVVCGSNSAADTLVLIENLPSNFILTGSIPSTVIVPAQGCDTIEVTGYFDEIGSCIDNINTAGIIDAIGDTLTADTCVTVVEPCLLNADLVIPDSSYSQPYGQLLSNISIYIEGRFYINDNLTLQNCAVTVAPGGQIIVLQDLLELDNTVIEGCGFMWKSIHLVSPAANILVWNGSRISDADTAISAENKTRISVYDSEITECVTGIYTEPLTNGNYSITTAAVYGTRFGMWHSSTFKPGYVNQPPHGSKPFAGIHYHNMAGTTIGDYGQAPNEFKDMNAGIVAEASIIRVLHSEFKHIQPVAIYNKPYNGTAVASIRLPSQTKADLSFFPVDGGGLTIDSSYRGVYTEYSTGKVADVRMDNTVTGVFGTKTTQSGKFEVTNCEITAKDYGIHWQDNHGAKEMKTESNYIYITYKQGEGIYLAEMMTGNSVKYTVNGNYVTLYGGRYGIHSLNVNSPQITYNVIDQQTGTLGSTPQSEGIAAEGSAKALISCNSVLIDYGGIAGNCNGIRISQSPDAIVQCNTTERHEYGIYFGGITPSVFRGNTMYDHYAGLYLNNVAVIDTQTHAGNRWPGTYSSGYGAVNMNADSAQALFSSLFVIDPNLLSDYTPAIPSDTLDPPFFVNDQGWVFFFPGVPFSCTGQYACNAFIIGGGSDDLKLRIAEDETLTSEYIPESNTIAKQYLYDELKQDSSLLNSNTVLQMFMQQQGNTNTGNLYETKAAIAKATTLDEASKITLLQIDSVWRIYSDSIFKADSMFYLSQNTVYLQQKENLIEQLNGLNDQWYSYIEQWKENVDTYIENALAYNISISGGDDPVINDKEINSILLKYIEGGKENIIDDYVLILSIAQQCPYKGGRAVYAARAMIKIFNDTIAYDDNAVCHEQGIFRTITTSSTDSQIKVSIKPNPANDKIEITLNGIEEGLCSIDIINMLDESVQRDRFNCSEKKKIISINRLLPGIYTTRVKINNEYFLSEKLVIIR